VIKALRRFAGAPVHKRGRKWGALPKWLQNGECGEWRIASSE